jgi:tRNA-intron endonuclease
MSPLALDSLTDSSEEREFPPISEAPLEQTFVGTLKGYRVYVPKGDSTGELVKRGLGDDEGSAISLRLYEAMYMVKQGWLTVNGSEGNHVSFEALVDRSTSEDSRGWTKFLVYRDLRSRGYVVREGYSIRSDLRVYARGDYPGSSAKYTVLPINEGEKVKLRDLKRMVETVYRMGKEPIVAVVERRGEIIYYRASKMIFDKN